MSKLPMFRIDEIAIKTAIGPFGSRMKSETYTQSGVPVIRGTNITGGRSFSGEWVYVSERDADQLTNCNVREGDLVFPTEVQLVKSVLSLEIESVIYFPRA